MKVKSIKVLVLFILILGTEVQAQNNSLSLEDAVSLAGQNNYDIRISAEQAEAARAQFQQANAVFLPQLSIEETAIRTTDPINAFGIKLSQKSITAADFAPAVLNDPDAISNFNTRLSFQQPVFNLDGIYERSAAQSAYKSAREMAEYTQFYQTFLVKQYYYQIVLLREKRDVINGSVEVAKSIVKQSNDYFDQGLITKADLLEAKVQLSKATEELIRTENEIESTIDTFSLLIGDQLSYSVEFSDDLEIDQVLQPQLTQSEFKNSGLDAMNFKLEATRNALKASKFKFLPRLNVFGSYEFNDDQLIGLENSNYTLGASLRWDLFKGSQNLNSVKQKKAELKTMELSYNQEAAKLNNAVRKAERSLEETIQLIGLNQLSAEQAQEDFSIRKNRYDQGLEKVSDLLIAENQSIQMQLMLLQSQFEYKVNLASLEFLLETNFN